MRRVSAVAGTSVSSEPRHVLLFSGHMVDAPARATPRFPADKVPIAAREIEAVLDRIGADAHDLALTQGAAGGDLLFAEACVKRGVRVQLLLPLPEDEFIRQSILPSADGESWRQRYLALKSQLVDAPRVMPDELGALPPNMNAFERCNLWLLSNALRYNDEQQPGKVHLICLWDGGGGDGPGGTAHMVDEVQRRGGRVSWLDTRRLW
jgi:hypothetical protein